MQLVISPTPHGHVYDLLLTLHPLLFWIPLALFWSCPTFSFTSLLSCCSSGVYNMLVNMAGPCVCAAGAWAALFLRSYITVDQGRQFLRARITLSWECSPSISCKYSNTLVGFYLPHSPYHFLLCSYNFYFVSVLYAALFNLQLFCSHYDGIYNALLH